VDEAFADRLQPGDRFLLDGRCLEYRRREEGSLLVEEVLGRPRVPLWGGDGLALSPELARRLYAQRVQAAEALREGPDALAELLRRDYGLSGSAVGALVGHFQSQETVSEIPDTKTVLIEAVLYSSGGAEYAVHTPLNRLGNDALARVAALRLARDGGRSAITVVADLGFLLRVRGGLAGDVPETLRRLLAAEGFTADLDRALADSAVFRERFRRVAMTGLMVVRNPIGRCRRVGGQGYGAGRLFDQVRQHDAEFVLLRQALREVRADLCDADASLAFAEALPGQAVRCRWLARPSPFVEGWTQAERGATESAETPEDALRRLHARLMGGPG
jgi:ATP-dependent Lhr-like helicase